MKKNIVPGPKLDPSGMHAFQMDIRTLFPVKEILKSRGYEVKKASDNQNYLEDLLIDHLMMGDGNYEKLLQCFNNISIRKQVRTWIKKDIIPTDSDALWIINHIGFKKDEQAFTKTFEWYVGEVMVRFFEGFSFAYGVEIFDVKHNQTGTKAGDFDTLVVMRNLELIYFECKTGSFDTANIQMVVDRALALNCDYVVIIAFDVKEKFLIEAITRATHPMTSNNGKLNKIQIKSKNQSIIYDWNNCYFISASKDFIEQMKTVLRVNEAKSVGLKYQITLGENDLSNMGYLVESLTAS